MAKQEPSKSTTSNAIRQAFLDYFAARDHQVVGSSSLVPGNDPTLLFTNAGMVQFKDVFLGVEQRDYQRAVTAQRCVRAGGKHNDLDQVGYTARHHTFFEMLGNFSFGDYFKQDAIRFAWEFLTEVVALPAERLWVTVYETDDEAYRIWAEDIGVPGERIVRIGGKPGAPYESDNFWAMGDTGPCGPCSEIFYDHGPAVEGGPPGSPEQDGDRYVEVWNLVFMQFDRDASGTMNPLPKPCVDTGMGLERLAAVLQGTHSNYEIDMFVALIAAASKATGCNDLKDSSLRVIADHIRACAFLIADGVLPSNEGRGYVLRRIIRRAVRHGYMLGQKAQFFYRMVPPLVDQMGEACPELVAKADHVMDVLRNEEARFGETLEQGMRLLEEVIESLSAKTIPGAAVFKLYDTYGFPVDLTADVARERGLSLDMAGFDESMAAQRQQAQAASRFDGGARISAELISQLPATRFVGYDQLTDVPAQVLAIICDGAVVDELQADTDAVLILDTTPFYAEAGGQIGDSGQLLAGDVRFIVEDTQKVAAAYHGHSGRLSAGQLRVGDTVTASIDVPRRQAIVLNHSGTHLLHAALRQVLGKHVEQKGSLVAADRLRFDFAHFEPVSDPQLREIEQLVNHQIRVNHTAQAQEMAYDDAIAAGAMALFGEKYGDQVRVLRFGEFSTELCGGTHVSRVGDIGLLKIVSETGIASGVRRIEALTGQGALDWIDAQQDRLEEIAQALKSEPQQVAGKVTQLVDRNRELERELTALKSKLAQSAGTDLAAEAKEVNGVKVVAAKLVGVNPKELREAVDQLKNKLGTAAIVLATARGDKVSLVAGVTKDVTGRIKAGDLVNFVAVQVGGKGGGRPDLAQAGGNQPESLPAALAGVEQWVQQAIGEA